MSGQVKMTDWKVNSGFFFFYNWLFWARMRSVTQFGTKTITDTKKTHTNGFKSLLCILIHQSISFDSILVVCKLVNL